MATYVFTGMFHVGAESEEEARDGLMELIAEIARNNDAEAFVLEETIPQEQTMTTTTTTTTTTETTTTRPLYVIAAEIKRDWAKPYFGAVPYLDAMRHLNAIDELYYNDEASDVVSYFIANAGTWKGDTARRVKAELRAMLKGK